MKPFLKGISFAVDSGKQFLVPESVITPLLYTYLVLRAITVSDAESVCDVVLLVRYDTVCAVCTDCKVDLVLAIAKTCIAIVVGQVSSV